MLQRLEVNENLFIIEQNDRDTGFYAERETLADGTRGHWLLWRRTIIGAVIVDRDQYSNDLIERVDCLVNKHGRPPSYDRRLKVPCSHKSYLEHAHIWTEELSFQFGGEWVAEYYDWDKQAVLCRKEGT